MWLFLLLFSFLVIVFRSSVEGNTIQFCCLFHFGDDFDLHDDESKVKEQLLYCLDESSACWAIYIPNFLPGSSLPICSPPDGPYCRDHPDCLCCRDDHGPVVCYNRTGYANSRTRLSGVVDKNKATAGLNQIDESTEPKAVKREVSVITGTGTGTITQPPNLVSRISAIASNSEDLEASNSVDFEKPSLTDAPSYTNTFNVTATSSSTDVKNAPSIPNTTDFTVVSSPTETQNSPYSSTITSTPTPAPDKLSNTSGSVSNSTNSADAPQGSTNHTVKPSPQNKGKGKINYNYFYILFVIPVIISVGVAYYIIKYKKRQDDYQFSVVERQSKRRKPDVRPSWVFSEPETSGNDDSGEEGNSLYNN